MGLVLNKLRPNPINYVPSKEDIQLMSNIILLKKIWEEVYNPTQDPALTIEKYFHPNFEQCINGVIMNRSQYIEHVNAQKLNFVLDSIDYKENLEKANELFSSYYIKGRNIKHHPIEANVIVYVRFEDQKILRIHGLVVLTKGDETDVDM